MKRARDDNGVVALDEEDDEEDEDEDESDEEDEDDDVEDGGDADALTQCLADIVGREGKTGVCTGDIARELPLPVLMVDGKPVALPLRLQGPSADLVGRHSWVVVTVAGVWWGRGRGRVQRGAGGIF